MEFNFKTDKSSDIMSAINSVLSEIGHKDSDRGIPVILEECEEGLELTRNNEAFVIKYSSRSALMRAVGLLSENTEKKKVNITEKPVFSVIGTILDNSRNAVHKVDILKKWIRINALMGFNSMILYTEDTYEIKTQPHFGYMRGRFTPEEIKELDDYAFLHGIELIPGIQTLAHLKTLFQWPEYIPLCDTGDILLAENEEVYKLIDDMLDTCKANFRTKKILLGMDEAQLLGRGQYLKLNGYKPVCEIMKKHLRIVVDKCHKRGLEPQIWSDMFFRMNSKKNLYYDRELLKIPQETTDSVPEGLTLLYWDYYSTDSKRYEFMFDRHSEFKNITGFAGGASNWYGIVPLNTFAANAARTALSSAIKHKTNQVWVTLWGDNGASCSLFSTLPTLQIYAEACWTRDMSEKHVAKRFKACTGADYYDFIDIELTNNIPERTHYGHIPANPYRYMLFQDILLGKFDRHIPCGTSEHFAEMALHLSKSKKKNKEYGYIFKTLISLCHALEIKSEIGIKIKKAYDNNDRTELGNIANKQLPELNRRLKTFYCDFKNQWNFENKPFGFEVQDTRLGGLILRTTHCIEIINDYLNNDITSIPELEVERLPFNSELDGKCLTPAYSVLHNRWHSFVTSNVMGE